MAEARYKQVFQVLDLQHAKPARIAAWLAEYKIPFASDGENITVVEAKEPLKKDQVLVYSRLPEIPLLWERDEFHYRFEMLPADESAEKLAATNTREG